MPLYEDSRPRSWSDVVGQDEIVSRLLAFRDRNGGHFGGNVFYVTGPSGTGKTTIARLIAADTAEPLNIIEVGGPKVTAEFCDKIERLANSKPVGGKGLAVIVNEVQSFTRTQVDRLLTLLEHDLTSHVVWIFTTTNSGSDRLFDVDEAPAFLSRAKKVKLAQQALAQAFAQRALEIARAKGLDGGKPLSEFVKLVKERRNNMRAVLEDIDFGVMLDTRRDAA